MGPLRTMGGGGGAIKNHGEGGPLRIMGGGCVQLKTTHMVLTYIGGFLTTLHNLTS